jgi:predicted anti-sigma-YlaC factor YlaD
VRVAGEITCAELVELVTDYLEGALPADRRTLFDEHVEACDWCRAYLDQVRQTLRALGTLTEDSISPQARDALLDAFRGWNAA